MEREALKIFSIWAWRVPYKEKFAILMDVVESGKIVSSPTVIKTSDFIRLLDDYLERNGLVNLGRQEGDHLSLMSSWI